MSKRTKLSGEQIEQRLKSASGWSLEGGALQRQVTFKDFVSAFGAMSSIALVAESMNHHPEWTNVYNRLTVRLSTHDVGGISELDFELAQRINAIVD